MHRSPARNPAPAFALALTLTLTLGACGEEQASAPGEMSAGEAKALDAAAAMLDQRRLPPGAIPPEPTPQAAPEEMTGDTAKPRGE